MIKSLENFTGLNVTFQVTEDCNLRCNYCYQPNKTPKYLSLEEAKKFIDIILEIDPMKIFNAEYAQLYRGLVLDFIGGDALMLPELCDSIMSYFIEKSVLKNHKWAYNWRASISTNGTFFENEEVRKFLLKYGENISLGVSVDGCPEIHNINRNNSMDKILKGWDWYLNYCEKFNITPTTKSTCNKESIPFLHDSVKYLHEELKLNNINMNFIFEKMELDEKDYSKLDGQLSKITDYLLNHYDDLYFRMLDKDKAIGKCLEEGSPKHYCGAGNMPTLIPGGGIYPCFRFIPSTIGTDKFKIGDVEKGIYNIKSINTILTCERKDISEEICINCPIQSACAWCIAGSYLDNKKLYRQTNICRITQLIDKHARNYWNKFNKLNNLIEKYKEIDYSVCKIT